MIHPRIKENLGFQHDISDEEFLQDWRKLISEARKPCWDLKYCPYGPLVEQFPLLPVPKAESIRHLEYIKSCLEKNTLGVKPNTKPMPEKIRTVFEKQVAEFDSDNYPDEVPSEIEEWSCKIFGHICPVVFSAEKVAEDQNN